MFRNPVSEFTLSATRAPRPSYRPAVEALEERLVLSGGVAEVAENLAPSDHSSLSPPQTDFSKLKSAHKILRFQKVLQNTLNRQLSELGQWATYLSQKDLSDPFVLYAERNNLLQAKSVLDATKSTLLIEKALRKEMKRQFIQHPELQIVGQRFFKRSRNFEQAQELINLVELLAP